jgi:hypothetical protein
MKIFKSKLKPMRIRQVGIHLSESYEDWRGYLNTQQQLVTMKKYFVPAVNELEDRLNSISNQFLGEKGLYHEMETLREKAKELRKDIVRFLKLKQFIK